MNPLVRTYLTNARNHELEIRGLFQEKQYVDDETMDNINEKGTEFLRSKHPGIQYDENEQRYFYPVQIEISDEDYAELMKYPAQQEQLSINTPAIGVILSILGWLIIIFSVIIAIWIAQQGLGNIALYIIAGGCLSSLTFFTFSKIIHLLCSINNNL